jgi:hypothetical protein
LCSDHVCPAESKPDDLSTNQCTGPDRATLCGPRQRHSPQDNDLAVRDHRGNMSSIRASLLPLHDRRERTIAAAQSYLSTIALRLNQRPSAR